MWIYSLAAAQILCYIGLIIMQTLQCRPVNKFWQFWVEGECFPFSWILLVLEIPNSLIDFALVALAMVMIKGIQLRTGSMWKLRFLFGLGSLYVLHIFVSFLFANFVEVPESLASSRSVCRMTQMINVSRYPVSISMYE